LKDKIQKKSIKKKHKKPPESTDQTRDRVIKSE
jgi:hypothetical protein